MISEEDLILKARHDLASREKLVLRYYDMLLSHIRTRLPMWLERFVDAEDVLQDTFARIFQSLESFEYRGKGSFFGWSLRVASNHILNLVDFYRSRKRHADVEDVSLNNDESSAAVALLYRLFRGRKSPGQLVADREMVQQLAVCMNQLEPQQLQVIQLRYVEGHSVKSAAGIMGRTERAIEQLTYRSLLTLRRMFPKSQIDRKST